MSMINSELLKILRCPETHQPLSEADTALITDLNGRIAGGALKNRAGKPVADRIDGGLLRQDRQFLYPVRNRIPVLLIEEAIPLA